MMKSKIAKTRKNNGLQKIFVFEYFAPQAKFVGVASDFNDWNAAEHPLNAGTGD